MKNYGIGNCKMCGILIQKKAVNHILCGDRDLKIGCSYKAKIQRALKYRTNNKDKIWQSYLKYKKIRKPYNKELQRNIAYKNKFGITLNDYNVMFKKQKGVCAICKQPETVKNYFLAVDHCHKTGKVRGLLCLRCNRGIGLLKDDYEILKSATKYLKKHLYEEK